jgi:uncharacterized protein with PIN domain
MPRRIKFYTDEHVQSAVVSALRRGGVDVLTAHEAGMEGVSDETHLAFAAREGRVLFTQDDDFLRLHAAGIDHEGIAYAHQQTPTGRVVRGLMLIFQVLDANEMSHHVEFL